MLSHEFARALLARRNNDLWFITEVSFPGKDDEPDVCRTQMADDRHRTIGARGPAPEVLEYDNDNDLLKVALGPTFAGQQGGYLLSPEEALVVMEALKEIPNPRSKDSIDLLKRMQQEI